MSINLDPEVIYKRLLKTGEDWADKKYAADLLDETKKSVLAQEFILAKDSEEKISDGKAEHTARASDGYVQHVTAMVEAKRAENLAKVKLDAAKAWFESMRTKAANMRTEANLAGGHR